MKINEHNITPTTGADVDDGPRMYFGDQKSYRQRYTNLAKKWGREIVDFIITDKEFFRHDTEYPKGPPPAVSFFPVGDKDAENAGTNYRDDLTNSEAYKKWLDGLAKKMGTSISLELSKILKTYL